MHEVFVWFRRLVFIDPRTCESFKVGLPSYLRKKTMGLSVLLPIMNTLEIELRTTGLSIPEENSFHSVSKMFRGLHN